MTPIPTIKLNTGTEIPAIGLGTYRSDDQGECARAIKYALTETPIRHLDAAYAYLNEHEVGQGIRDAIATGKVKRSEIFVTTKVYMSFHKNVAEALEISLKNLGLEYVDLLLMHWPLAFKDPGNGPLFPKEGDPVDPSFDLIDNWKQFEQVYKSGKAKAIGVSNYSIPILEKLLANTDIVPAVNQIEGQPLLPAAKINAFCKEHGIVVETYCPLGRGTDLMKNPDILSIAEKHKVSPATVLISWHVNEGRVPLPKSVTPSRIASNCDWIKLDSEDLHTLDTLYEKYGVNRIVSPPFGKSLGFDNWD